jgi:hypothetical protein
MDFLYAIFIDPFVQMVELPDFCCRCCGKASSPACSTR